MGRPLRERPISYLPSSCPSSGARLLFERRFIRGVLSHRSLQRPSERRPDSRAGEADRRQGIEHQTDRAVEEPKPVAVEDDHRLRPRLLDLPTQDKAHYERSRAEAVAECERSEEHTSELQSLMRSSYAGFCLKKQKKNQQYN